jgi:hypothetical protein
VVVCRHLSLFGRPFGQPFGQLPREMVLPVGLPECQMATRSKASPRGHSLRPMVQKPIRIVFPSTSHAFRVFGAARGAPNSGYARNATFTRFTFFTGPYMVYKGLNGYDMINLPRCSVRKQPRATAHQPDTGYGWPTAYEGRRYAQDGLLAWVADFALRKLQAGVASATE